MYFRLSSPAEAIQDTKINLLESGRPIKTATAVVLVGGIVVAKGRNGLYIESTRFLRNRQSINNMVGKADQYRDMYLNLVEAMVKLGICTKRDQERHRKAVVKAYTLNVMENEMAYAARHYLGGIELTQEQQDAFLVEKSFQHVAAPGLATHYAYHEGKLTYWHDGPKGVFEVDRESGMVIKNTDRIIHFKGTLVEIDKENWGR